MTGTEKLVERIQLEIKILLWVECATRNSNLTETAISRHSLRDIQGRNTICVKVLPFGVTKASSWCFAISFSAARKVKAALGNTTYLYWFATHSKILCSHLGYIRVA